MSNHLLTTTDWLAEHLDDDTVRVVDIRGHVRPASDPKPHYFNHRTDYEDAHIPGAVFVDWVHEITDPDSPHHAQIAKSDRFADVLRRLGIAPDTHVVAYDDANGMFAARLWWALNYYGHRNVTILDGGWEKWVGEGRPVTRDIPQLAPSSIVIKPDESWRRTDQQVLEALGSNKVQLIDVRSPEEFAGKSSRVERAGHIPGAINIPRTTLIRDDGQLHKPDDLRAIFEKYGIRYDVPEVIVYCNGGVSASYGLLALQAAGYTNGSMYDGSWKEWGSDMDKPIE